MITLKCNRCGAKTDERKPRGWNVLSLDLSDGAGRHVLAELDLCSQCSYMANQIESRSNLFLHLQAALPQQIVPAKGFKDPARDKSRRDSGV